jgi:hypothetical protein
MAFAFESTPLHGLLKHETEDELIFIGTVAGKLAIFTALAWPAEGPNRATLDILRGAVPKFVTSGPLAGKLHHRLLNDQEWRWLSTSSATHYPTETGSCSLTWGIRLTTGTQSWFPPDGTIYVNMGDKYIHNGTILDGPALFHELTHVWQLSRDVLSAIFVYRGLGTHVEAAIDEEDPYPFKPGKQWARYNLEQQASIVEAWTLGATEKAINTGLDADTVPRPVPPQKPRPRRDFTIPPPLFRYINGNIRRADTSARTRSGRSARELLKESGRRTMREMLPSKPQIWW